MTISLSSFEPKPPEPLLTVVKNDDEMTSKSDKLVARLMRGEGDVSAEFITVDFVK